MTINNRRHELSEPSSICRGKSDKSTFWDGASYEILIGLIKARSCIEIRLFNRYAILFCSKEEAYKFSYHKLIYLMKIKLYIESFVVEFLAMVIRRIA